MTLTETVLNIQSEATENVISIIWKDSIHESTMGF